MDPPLLCSKCLGESLKLTIRRDLKGSQCTLCTRPFPSFAWRKHNMVQEKTRFCPSCADQNNCCQCCYRNFATGLSFAVHQAAKLRSHATPQLLKHAALQAEQKSFIEVSQREYDKRINQKLVNSPAYSNMLATLAGQICTSGHEFLLVNVDPLVNQASLEDALKAVGNIEALRLYKSARCGFVKFTNEVNAGNGILVVDGIKLRLVAAQPFSVDGSHAEISLLVQRFMRGSISEGAVAT